MDEATKGLVLAKEAKVLKRKEKKKEEKKKKWERKRPTYMSR